jgi:acetoin utilization deacetylase AcuC-like enzyme
MGFCALNALAVALKRFLQLNNPNFQRLHGRSIRVAILDLDIHAGNGTELVFRDSRSVLHVSFHRYGWLNSGDSGAERVMPGTHYYKDVGGIFGKNVKKPRGEGYSVNITLRKGDGNAEVLSAFEAVAIPVMQEFAPDLILVACGFDGLKLSPVFKQRWGEGSCPGMDAEYTPSLFGYIVNRVRSEVQKRIVAATEGGYDPLSVGLAARSVVKALKGSPIQKPPLRTFNSDWLPQLNNIFQHQQIYWSSLVL